MKIAVAGATGRIGRQVREVLEARGHDVIAISRSSGVDVITGKGLANALSGVECVIDAAGIDSTDQKTATEFFTTAARNLQEAGERAGVERLIVVSIIGIDRFTSGYMAAKLAHEKAMRAGPIPAQVLRAAQFHEFVDQVVGWGRQGEVSYVPKMRTQLVAARTVAGALADMAVSGSPAAEIAGPRPENLVDAARRLVARRGDALRIEGAGNPADPDNALLENGALLPGPGAMLAGPTFAEWLEAAFPARSS